jgi:hypothetical protein
MIEDMTEGEMIEDIRVPEQRHRHRDRAWGARPQWLRPIERRSRVAESATRPKWGRRSPFGFYGADSTSGLK